MRTSEVRPGMTGYGLSVFSGTTPVRFEVEVVSVLKNQLGPQQDVVLIRCRGQGLEHSGAIAGMSGSPVFLKDDQGRERLIGAFALGWEYAKDPLAGVRPIEEMLRIPTAAPEAPRPEAEARGGTWDARPMITRLNAPTKPPVATAPEKTSQTTMRPLTLPLAISGVGDRFIEQMRPLLDRENLALFQSASGGEAPASARDAKLAPGAAIGVPVISGDLNLSAIGTVTEIIGDRIFAFGHEFNAEGAVELPMGVGYIHSVIASQAISFKLGSLVRVDGAIHSDETTGIAGLVGKAPAMIPVEIEVRTSQRAQPQTYKYEVVRHPRFTPLASSMAVASAVMGNSRLPEEFTLSYSLKFEFEGGEAVEMKNISTSLVRASEFVRDLSLPVSAALENRFARVYPKRITGRIDLTPSLDVAVMRSAITDKQIYKPGETVRVVVESQVWRGEDEKHVFEFPLPRDLSDGPCQLIVSDGQRFVMDEMRFAPAKFQSTDLRGVFGMMRSLTSVRSDMLYFRLTTRGEGVAVGRTNMPHLPALKRDVLLQEARPDVVMYLNSVVKSQAIKRPMMGAVDLAIMVAEHPDKQAKAPSRPPQGQPPAQRPQPGPSHDD